jgi:cytochrome P450
LRPEREVDLPPRFGDRFSIAFVKAALTSRDLIPKVPDIDEFVGLLGDLALLQALPPSEHDRTRRVMNRHFCSRAVGHWDSRIRSTCRKVLSTLVAGDLISLRDQYALPVAHELTACFVGVPTDEVIDAVTFANQARSFTRLRRSQRVLALLRLGRLVESHRPTCGEPPLPLLVALRGPLSDEIVRAIAVSMLSAGVELVTRSVLACIWAYSAERERSNRGLYTSDAIDRAVAAARIIPRAERMAVRDVQIEDRLITSGQHLAFDICPAIVPTDGGRYRAGDTRVCPLPLPNGNDLLPFGFGPHFCPGASWTRHIVRYACSAFYERFPESVIVRTIEADSADPLGGPSNLLVKLGRTVEECG